MIGTGFGACIPALVTPWNFSGYLCIMPPARANRMYERHNTHVPQVIKIE